MTREWTELIRTFAETGDLVLGDARVDSPLARAEAVRYLTRLMSAGALCEIENHDPAYPHLTRIVTPWMQWAYPNPDYVQWQVPVHGDYTYRIFGERGTARFLAVEVYTGDWPRMANMHVVDSMVHVADGRGELAVGANGDFEVVLSREKRNGNWLELPPEDAIVIVRNAYYDWETEEPSKVFVEREGAVYPPPPTTAGHLNERLQLLLDFFHDVPPRLAKAIDVIFSADSATVPFPSILQVDREFQDQCGFRGQYYAQGHYRCGPDEAVILEVAPPDCFYWGFHLLSQFWEAGEWTVRQHSINGRQAIIDSDGVFRAVIAHQDPGVPNWLDTGNHAIGLIGGRYNRTSSVPIPTLRTVPFEKLRDELPPETAVVTQAERSEALRRRMHSIRRRNAD